MARVYDRFLKQRISRRRALKGGAATAAGLAVIGCTGGGGGGGNGSGNQGQYTPDPNETPTTNGILRQREANVYPSLSPFGITALGSSLLFGFTTYDHLWYVPIDTGEIENMLAENVEIVDPEAMQINVTLHEAFFHDKSPVDGRQVLASDVVASWEAFRDDPFGLGRDWLRGIVESMEAPEDRLFVLKQKRPYAWVFGTSAAGSPASSSVLPAETIDNPDVNLDNDVYGSGRFVLADHQGGENLQFRRFENWRIPGEPFLEGLDRVLITDFSSAEAQFRAGNIDELSFQNKLQADDMLSQLADQMYLTTEVSRAYHSLMIKATPPFDDPRVIEAFNLAINREEMIQLVERDVEGGIPAGIVQPALEIYAFSQDELADTYFRHDQDRARSLLEEADFPFDQDFTLLISSPNEELADRAKVLKDQMSRVGVSLTIEQQDLLSVWVPRVLTDADYTMTLFTHLAYEDPYLPMAFYTNFSPIGPSDDRGRNSMEFYDEEISAAVDATSLELELEPRVQKVREAQQLIMDKQAPMINIYSSVTFTGRRHWFKGWVAGRGSFGLFNGQAWIDTSLRG